MSLSTIPKEVLFTISCYLAENPKDLVHFGRTNKLVNEIANEQIFKRLLQLCKKESLSKKRLSELRGPTGFDGLIDEAYRYRNLKNAEAGQILVARELSQNPDGSIRPAMQAVTAYNQAQRNYTMLMDEFYELVRFKDNEIIAGKIHDLPIMIQDEIKGIQEFLSNRL